ncbi:MAG: enolase C-terminal domain-like protein [Caldilineaceae bacterium]
MNEAKPQGFVHFNFKAAVAPETDVEVAETVKAEIRRGGFVWADANQGFQLHAARKVAHAFESIGVDVLEQPLPAGGSTRCARCVRARRSPWLWTKPLWALRTSSTTPLPGWSTSSRHQSHPRRRHLAHLATDRHRRSRRPASARQRPHRRLLTRRRLPDLLAFSLADPPPQPGSQFTDESMIFPSKAEIEHGSRPPER